MQVEAATLMTEAGAAAVLQALKAHSPVPAAADAEVEAGEEPEEEVERAKRPRATPVTVVEDRGTPKRRRVPPERLGDDKGWAVEANWSTGCAAAAGSVRPLPGCAPAATG